jgi:hypothetical protein
MDVDSPLVMSMSTLRHLKKSSSKEKDEDSQGCKRKVKHIGIPSHLIVDFSPESLQSKRE